MTRLVWRGSLGVLRWSYLQAAVVGAWTMQTEGVRTTLTGTLVTQDTYAVTQRPLTFEVPRPGKAPWRWILTELQIADATITATVVPQE